MVVVAVQELGTGVETCSRPAGRAWMVLDRNGETARRYNALWLPRAYALDEEGNVTYVQPATTLDPQAPLQVAALWSEGSRLLASGRAPAASPADPGTLTPAALFPTAPAPERDRKGEVK